MAYRATVVDVPVAVQVHPNRLVSCVLFPWLRAAAEAKVLRGSVAAASLYFRWPSPRDPVSPAWRWVYFARRGSDGVFKVGLSADPVARMSSLRDDVGGGFALIAAVPYCGPEHEKALLSLLRGVRKPYGVEWFRNSGTVRALAWTLLAARNTGHEQSEALSLSWRVHAAMRGLAYLCGWRPARSRWRHGCGICGQIGHNRVTCKRRQTRHGQEAA